MKKRTTRKPAATPNSADRPEPDAAPATPPDVLMQACACCGAILPAPLLRLDAIPGQEHLRRAVTVALTGNHPITFLGSGGALADALAFGRISHHYGVTAYVTTACMCGNAGDPYLACCCTPDVLVAWQRRPAFQAALAAGLVVEAAHASAEQRMAHRRGRRGEPDELLIGRAREARSRPRPSDTLDAACQRLLAAAIRQLQLTTEQVARMISVAQSVAQLAEQPAIQPAHLAEALQYRSRIVSIVAMRWRYITFNAASLVETPRIEQHKIQPLTKQEARQFLDTIKGHRFEALYLLALFLGLREGEVLGLLIHSIDVDKAAVTVDGALQWQRGKLVRVTTKTKASIRILPLPPSLIPLLKAHIENQTANYPDGEWLFTAGNGGPLSPFTLIPQFKALL